MIDPFLWVKYYSSDHASDCLNHYQNYIAYQLDIILSQDYLSTNHYVDDEVETT